ncbi:MAG: SUMF1/EgtB/PvdO family nonheme iron enzyme, partial [Bacteroidales bacterium]|nr:SUMF1/EgtB/PvdO family nonheme iron enzyme [Bacteroidales bacterium]
LIKTLRDSIWVNKWPAKNKTIYTIYSLIPEGFDSPLFEENISSEYHFVSLWNHKELLLDTIYNKTYVPVKTNAFDKSWLGTRREGNIDCIAKFGNLLKVDLNFDTLIFQSDTGTKISVYTGNPSYQTNFKDFTTEKQKLKLYDIFGRYEGKFVVQLFDKNELIDERIVFIKPGTTRLISKVIKTKFSAKPPKNMLEIPAGEFTFKIEKNWSFIPYPYYSEPWKIKMKSFYMDKYPVTNKQFYKFIKSAKYIPKDTTNFLKNWKNGKYPKGEENYPVVYVSYKDAQAYAEWTGKRLPTEIEWQYAAQGFDEKKWPWGNEFDSTKCNDALGYPTPVNAFESGKSPFGIMD